jgi:hypothetical protein
VFLKKKGICDRIGIPFSLEVEFLKSSHRRNHCILLTQMHSSDIVKVEIAKLLKKRQ